MNYFQDGTAERKLELLQKEKELKYFWIAHPYLIMLSSVQVLTSLN